MDGSPYRFIFCLSYSHAHKNHFSSGYYHPRYHLIDRRGYGWSGALSWSSVFMTLLPTSYDPLADGWQTDSREQG